MGRSHGQMIVLRWFCVVCQPRFMISNTHTFVLGFILRRMAKFRLKTIVYIFYSGYLLYDMYIIELCVMHILYDYACSILSLTVRWSFCAIAVFCTRWTICGVDISCHYDSSCTVCMVLQDFWFLPLKLLPWDTDRKY